MARFHGLIGLLALTSVSALFLSSPAVSQPYPGYDGNPQFRFTNGAVGTVQALREDGTADVDYYDGSGIASANVAASADTSTATDRDTGDVARFMEQLEDIGLTNPNVCLDGDNNVASDKKAEKLLLKAIAIACFCGRPSFFSFLIFAPIVFWLKPLLRGIILFPCL